MDKLEKRIITIEGVDLHYAYFISDKSSNIPIYILIHGLNNDYTSWSAYIDAFPIEASEATFFIVDLPGYGKSDKILQYSLEEYSKYIVPFLNELIAEYELNPKNIFLVGSSMGAYVALETHRQLDKKIGGTVLLSPLDPNFINTLPGWILAKVCKYVIGKEIIERFLARMARTELFARISWFINCPNVNYKQYRSLCMPGQILTTHKTMMANVYSILRYDLIRFLSEVLRNNKNVMLFTGSKDKYNVSLIEEYLKNSVSNLTTYNHKVVDGAGHVLIYEIPKRIRELIEEKVNIIISRKN